MKCRALKIIPKISPPVTISDKKLLIDGSSRSFAKIRPPTVVPTSNLLAMAFPEFLFLS
jgi:hypothetical protein